MANLTPAISFDDVYQLEAVDDVQGGPGAIDNWQAQALANRDAYIRWLIDGFAQEALDTTTFTHAYPIVTALPSVVNGTTYIVSANLGKYTLPPISGVADDTTIRIVCQAHLAALISADGSETINCIDPMSVNDTDQVVFSLEVATFKKFAGDTQWTMYTENRGQCGTIVLMPNNGVVSPSVSNGFAPCNGAGQSTTDPRNRRLFSVIGYTFGGSGGTFNVPTITPPGGYNYQIFL